MTARAEGQEGQRSEPAIRVFMHNSFYLGGVLAILEAWAFHIVVRLKTKCAG